MSDSYGATLSPIFNDADADLVLLSAYKATSKTAPSVPEQPVVEFKVHKSKLAAASSVFSDMLAVGKEPEAGETRYGLPVVNLEEGSQTLDILLRLAYNDHNKQPDTDSISYGQVFELWTCATKYVMANVQWMAESLLKTRLAGATDADVINACVAAAMAGRKSLLNDGETRLLPGRLEVLLESGLCELPKNDLVAFVCKHSRENKKKLKAICATMETEYHHSRKPHDAKWSEEYHGQLNSARNALLKLSQ